MADIFLSYSEKDREIVRQVADILQAVGWSVWWDRRIPAGSTWRDVLEREMQSMRCMVVVWSSHSIVSEWVLEEASEGRRLGRLVPVTVEAVRPPTGFREVQAADLIGWNGSASTLGMQHLIEDIERKIGKPLPGHAGDDVTRIGTPAEPPKPPPQPTPGPPPRRPLAATWLPISRRTLLLVATALLIGAIAIRVGIPRSGSVQPVAGSPAPEATAPVKAPPIAHVFDSSDEASPPAPSNADSTDGRPPDPISKRKPRAAMPAKVTKPRCADLVLSDSIGQPVSPAVRSSIERECAQ